jgi:hypothetical protein
MTASDWRANLGEEVAHQSGLAHAALAADQRDGGVAPARAHEGGVQLA